MPPRADTGPYRINEKVLVPYTDKHYTAKVDLGDKQQTRKKLVLLLPDSPLVSLPLLILQTQVTKAERTDDGFRYLVHYTVSPRLHRSMQRCTAAPNVLQHLLALTELGHCRAGTSSLMSGSSWAACASLMLLWPTSQQQTRRRQLLSRAVASRQKRSDSPC